MKHRRISVFKRQMATLMISLLADPLSDRTRKSQTGLIVASAACLIFANSLLTFENFTALGIKFKPENQEFTVHLSLLACAYFFVVFCTDYWRDIWIYRYTRLPAILHMETLSEDMVSEAAKLGRDFDAVRDVVEKRVGARAQLMKELNSIPQTSPLEREAKQAEFDLLCQTDNVDQLVQNMKALNAKLESATAVKSAFLSRSVDVFRSAERLRLFVEVAFPLGLMATAVWKSVGYFHRIVV
ncbi:MAG: hypothetical protein ACXWPM_11840 [Bdellovibrionota bacterium]